MDFLHNPKNVIPKTEGGAFANNVLRYKQPRHVKLSRF